MARRTCKICGADVGSAEFDTCGRHACQRAALGPGADDDRQPTRCVHCGLVGSGAICPRCSDLLSDIGEVSEELAARDALSQLSVDSCRLSEKTKPAPFPLTTDNCQLTTDNCQLTTATLRARLEEAGRRREYVWLAGRADLLQRCTTFGPMARAQPR